MIKIPELWGISWKANSYYAPILFQMIRLRVRCSEVQKGYLPTCGAAVVI